MGAQIRRIAAEKIIMEVPLRHFWAVPLLVGGDVPSLLSAYGRYTLLSRGPDVDSEKTWHCLKDVIICRLLTVLHKSIDNRKEIHDLNYLDVRGFSEAS